MITLHHLEYSQSFRILWLLEEIGEPYELKLYNRDPQSNLAPAGLQSAFSARHRAGCHRRKRPSAGRKQCGDRLYP